MAMNVTIVRNTNQETILHFESIDASAATIDISTLTADTQSRNADVPKVNIIRFVTTGEDNASITVSRDSKLILACAPENAPFLDLTSMGISEAQKNDKNIVITSSVAKQVTGYITVRKVQGWSTKVETATYGSYDNQTVVGS